MSLRQWERYCPAAHHDIEDQLRANKFQPEMEFHDTRLIFVLLILVWFFDVRDFFAVRKARARQEELIKRARESDGRYSNDSEPLRSSQKPAAVALSLCSRRTRSLRHAGRVRTHRAVVPLWCWFRILARWLWLTFGGCGSPFDAEQAGCSEPRDGVSVPSLAATRCFSVSSVTSCSKQLPNLG